MYWSLDQPIYYGYDGVEKIKFPFSWLRGIKTETKGCNLYTKKVMINLSIRIAEEKDGQNNWN